MQGVQVQSLIGSLRFHMPLAKKPKHKKPHKQYCNIFNKDFTNGSHKKKNLKKKKKQNTADTPKCPINPTQGLLNYTSILSQEVSVLMTYNNH